MGTTSEPNAIRELLFSLGKVVDRALVGDAEAVVSYTEQMADRLAGIGEGEASERLRQMIGRKKGRTATLARAATDARRLPVDSESRFPVADEKAFSRGSVPLFLSADAQAALGRFLAVYGAADQLAERGLAIAPSMLLYGPPGCGKTQLVHFIASEVGLPLITARMDSLISSYLGSTAKNLRMLFDFAASHPCILFLDEFDAIAKMRDDTRELGELKRVVISLLQNIDALGRDHLIIAATNHEHLLDAAVWRRFSTKLKVGFPDEDARRQILSLNFRGFASEAIIGRLVAITEGASGAQLRDIAEECARDAVLAGAEQVPLRAALDAAVRITEVNGKPLSLPQQMFALYSRDKKTFTQAHLAELFQMSQPQVSRILKECRDEHDE